jgi:hypothetical protein
MAWYDPNGFGWSNIEAIWIPSITHWMPVELPKVEKTWTAGEDIKKGDAVYFRENGGNVFGVQGPPKKKEFVMCFNCANDWLKLGQPSLPFVLPDDLKDAIVRLWHYFRLPYHDKVDDKIMYHEIRETIMKYLGKS